MLYAMRNFLTPVTVAPQLGTNFAGPKSGAHSGRTNLSARASYSPARICNWPPRGQLTLASTCPKSLDRCVSFAWPSPAASSCGTRGLRRTRRERRECPARPPAADRSRWQSRRIPPQTRCSRGQRGRRRGRPCAGVRLNNDSQWMRAWRLTQVHPVPTLVLPHVDERESRLSSFDSSLHDGLWVAHEREHRPIGGDSGIDVQQTHASHRGDGVGDGIDHLPEQVAHAST